MAAAVHSAPEVPLLSLIKSTPKDVLDALSTIGFIHLDLDGTGLTQEDVDRAFQLSKLIHNVPLEDRVDLKLDPRGNGYMPMKGSLDERSSSVDFKEAYVWGRFKSSAGETQTIQKLPKVVADLRHEIEEFDNKCFEASLRVLDMLSQALSLPSDFFRSTHKDAGSNGLSFLHYPALDKPPSGQDIRAGSHKGTADPWGDITLLFQEKNGQPGLQIYLPDEVSKQTTGMRLVQSDFDLESGTWISAPIIPNTVLVNVGLTLEGMTDGLCKANVHRVVFPTPVNGELPRNRKSIAYFSTPSHDVVMNAVRPGGIVMKTQGASTVGDFFMERQRLAKSGYSGA